MTQLVLQPSAAPASKEHFRHTVAKPIDLADHLGLWGSEREELLRLVDSGHVQMWGVTAGASEKQWAKLEKGDRVIFAGNKMGFLTGTVLLKFQNAALAEDLWGLDRQGRPWQFMYALTDSRYISLPTTELVTSLGYAANHNVQGFTVCDAEKCAPALALIEEAPTADHLIGCHRLARVN